MTVRTDPSVPPASAASQAPFRPGRADDPTARPGFARARRRWIRLRPYALPALTTLGLGLARLTSGGFKVDTALYAGVAQRMVETGRWWTPMAGPEAYFNKPPLVLWIHALCMHLTGPALWGVRLPQLAAAIGCVLAAVHIARRLTGPSAALVAGMVFALTWPFAKHLNRLVLDYWTVCFILLAVAFVVEAWSREARGARAAAWMLAAGVAIGLSTLCKPFFAFLAPPVLALWLLLERRPRLALWTFAALPAALAVNLPWHLSMAHLHGEVFTSQYFGREILSRGVGDGGFGRRPWWWYAYFVAREWWPWQMLFYVGVAALALRSVRGEASARTHERSALRFTLVWAGVWLVLLALFADKRGRYMMHLWPALALPVSVWITRFAPAGLRRGSSRPWTALALAALLAGVIGLIVGVVTRADRADDDWRALTQRLREIRATEPHTPFHEAFRHPPRAGQVYMTAGVWPAPVYHGAPAEFREPPEGAVVLADDNDLEAIGLEERFDERFGKWRLLRYQPDMAPAFRRWLEEP